MNKVMLSDVSNVLFMYYTNPLLLSTSFRDCIPWVFETTGLHDKHVVAFPSVAASKQFKIFESESLTYMPSQRNKCMKQKNTYLLYEFAYIKYV